MMLLILSGIMAASSFLVGLLPLSFSLSSRQLHIITQTGGGILIGTAFTIIIPEGIAALYESKDSTKSKEPESIHAVIGMALVVGFLLMYLIDVLPSKSAKGHAQNGHIPLSSMDSGEQPKPITSSKDGHSNTTTIGLVIHAFADGIALGASSATPPIGLVVFLAIMVHKAPVAFSLTTTLLKQGLNKRQARAHLLMFSLAAPLGAFVTWLAVQSITSHAIKSNPGDSSYWAGLALVFSGGTFL